MSARSKGARGLIAGGCIGLLVLTGCTTGGDSGGVSTDTIRGAWITDPTSFDPALTKATDDYRAVRLIYDTVVRRDLDGELIPGIADEWEQTDDGAILTIAEGHTCADGTEITPTVVADSLEYLADPETNSVHTVGIFGDGTAKIAADDGASTVTIKLSKPHSDLLPGLTMPQAGIICPAGFEDLEGLAAGSVEDAASGPYVMTKSDTGVSYQFDLRENYDSWVEYSEPLEGTPAQHLEFVVSAEDTVANQLLTKELDVAPVTAEELPRFKGEDAFDLTTATTGEYYILFNGRDGSPFEDEKMRRAVAQVVDRDALRDIIDPEGELISTLGDENMLCANTDDSLLVDQDEDAAKEVLDGVSINAVGTNAIGQNGAGIVYLQEKLASAGADADLTNVDVGTWVDRIEGGKPESWDITLYATVNNMGTISWGLGTVIGKPSTEGGRNISLLQNPEATEELEAALAATSEEQMCEHYERAQQFALDSLDFIPVSMVTQSIVSREGFSVEAPAGKEDATTLRITV